MKNKDNLRGKKEKRNQGRGDKTVKGFESAPGGPAKDIIIRPLSSKDTQIQDDIKKEGEKKSAKEKGSPKKVDPEN